MSIDAFEITFLVEARKALADFQLVELARGVGRSSNRTKKIFGNFRFQTLYLTRSFREVLIVSENIVS